MPAIITLTTDFGLSSPYIAQMKGVILSLAPDALIVDISHAVPPQAIRHAAIVLEETVPRFPPQSIHICVVDPGVGTDRAILAVELGGRRLIAPDNGVLTGIARRLPVEAAVRLTRTEFWLPTVSATFHGRDIMAPVAAHSSRGVPLERMGEPTDAWLQLDDSEIAEADGRVNGQVLYVDDFGNLITNIRQEHLASAPPAAVHVALAGRTSIPLVRTYGSRAAGTLVALIGSSGRLEVATVEGDAARQLNCRAGDPVTVQWNSENSDRPRGC